MKRTDLRTRRLLGSVVLGLMLASAPATAQLLPPGVPITLHSTVLGEDRTVFVSLPASYSRGAARYPVLYVTDATWNFAHTMTSAQFLARERLIPDLIVVGITNPDRVRDLYATRADFKTGSRVIPFPTSGNADRFLEFIERELVSWTEHTYRASGLRILAGHSAGGNFALHAMRTRPGVFQAILATSPWLAWDDHRERKELVRFLASQVVGVRNLFLSYADEGRDMKADVDSLISVLKMKDDSSLRWTCRTYPDETHNTGTLKAYYDGLQAIFAGYGFPRDANTGRLAGSLDDVKAHYANLGRQLGTPFEPPENLVNELGYQYLGASHLDSALAAFRFNTERHAESANAWDSFGEALERSGRASEALAKYRRAVEIAERQRHPDLAKFRNNLARVSAAQGLPLHQKPGD